MSRRRFTVVRSSELAAVGSWDVNDFIAENALHVCHECGLAPAAVQARGRTNPVTALLETDPPAEGDPLRRSSYRCRDRIACRRRAGLRR